MRDVMLLIVTKLIEVINLFNIINWGLLKI